MPKQLKKQINLLSPIDNSGEWLTDSAKRQARWSCDSCVRKRPNPRIWDFYRKYALKSRENKIV